MNIGEVAALSAAFLWASASLLYNRISLPAASLNLAKNALASLMILVHVLVLAAWQSVPAFQATAFHWVWLSLSALIGITVGDTLGFRSMQILGPRKFLMLGTLAPVFAALLGMTFLGESLSLTFVAGMSLTISGVLAVIRDRKATDESVGLFPGSVTAGVWCGVLAAVCQAFGAVCAKTGLEGISSEEGTFIRVSSATVMAVLYVAARRQTRDVVKAMRDRSTLKKLLPATAIGTWLGIWLCQVAYQNCSVSVSTVLLSTTPLFAIPLVRIFYGHPISGTAVFGAGVAIVGVYLVVS